MSTVVATAAKPTHGIRYALLVGIFTVVLLIAQLATGTSPEFAFAISGFVVINAITFRLVGGFGNILGMCILFWATQNVIAGMVLKALYLQGADDIMYVPMKTIGVYIVGSLAFLLGAVMLKAFRIDQLRPFLRMDLDKRKLFWYGIILVFISGLRAFLVNRLGVADEGGLYIGGAVGPLRQFHFTQYLAIVASTAYVIVATEGKRCFNWMNGFAMAISILAGWVFAVRQDIVWAIVVFVATCLAMNFKFKLRHYVFFAGFVLFFQFVVSPYALYARGEVREGDFGTRMARAIEVFGEVMTDPEKYQQREQEIQVINDPDRVRSHYFGKPNNLFERYSLIHWASSVVYNTDIRGTTGDERITHGFRMVTPRFLNNPDKPAIGTANMLGHEGRGLLNDDDFFTQITLGFLVDAYNARGMLGVFLTCLSVFFAYGLVMALVCRLTLINNIFALGLFYQAMQVFSERTIASQVLFILQDVPLYAGFCFFILLIVRFMTNKGRTAPNLYERVPGAKRVESAPTQQP